MPRKDYQKAYAKTPAGKAARARAHARYVSKRRDGKLTETKPDRNPLVAAMNNWRTS